MSYIHDPGVTIAGTPTATPTAGQQVPLINPDNSTVHCSVEGFAAYLKTNLLGIDPITTPVASASYTVQGPMVNFVSTSMQYSTNAGGSWGAAPTTTFTSQHFSFTAPGLTAGTYTVWVRDTTQTTVVGKHPAMVVV
jgi:hypothetical protein